jgi:hypothetical protein
MYDSPDTSYKSLYLCHILILQYYTIAQLEQMQGTNSKAPDTNQCMGMFLGNKKVGVGKGSVIVDCFTKDPVNGTKGQVFLGNKKVDVDGSTQIHKGPENYIRHVSAPGMLPPYLPWHSN